MKTVKTVTTMKASELTAGVVGVEGDGGLVDILEVVKTTPKTITVRLLARNSMTMRTSALQTFRKTANIRVLV
jgi:hypothetical protein